MLVRLFWVVICVCLYSSGIAFSAEIQILKLSPADGRATLKMSDGRMQVIKVGDSVGENDTVIEILKGRVVIEERTNKGIETVIIRLVDGKQSVERIRKAGEEQPGLYSPTYKDGKLANGQSGSGRQ
jgi:hypothetical protein